MALKIKENNGTFLLVGTINGTTVKQFKNHLEFLLAYTKSLTINIERVTAIDRMGLKAIEDIFRAAKNYNKVFSIIGYGCKEIYDDIDMQIAA